MLNVVVERVRVKGILTRSSGYLLGVSSHSLQPYAGCALGGSLCGVGCYMRHSAWINRGREWGRFVEVRENADEVYRRQYGRERAWARRVRGGFGIFFSSATEPFQPIERSAGVTRSLLETMTQLPPDVLIVQTHSHHVGDEPYLPIYQSLAQSMGGGLRFHISIESDRDDLPGLPRSASSVAKRCMAAGRLKERGFSVVVTVAPLLPILDPPSFFRRLGEVADRVVIDHFIGGDGSPTADGSRTRRTRLPLAMESALAGSSTQKYRDAIVDQACSILGPERVGVGIAGFAGQCLSHVAS